MTRKECLPIILLLPETVLADIRAIFTWSSAIDIIRPVFDLCRALHTLLVGFSGEVSKFPGKEPLEQDGHDEPDGDNPNDEDEGYIKNNGRSHASNGLRVDKSNGDDVLKTVSNLLLLGTSEKHS